MILYVLTVMHPRTIFTKTTVLTTKFCAKYAAELLIQMRVIFPTRSFCAALTALTPLHTRKTVSTLLFISALIPNAPIICIISKRLIKDTFLSLLVKTNTSCTISTVNLLWIFSRWIFHLCLKTLPL